MNNIPQLQPGPIMDEFVAEKVLGWKKHGDSKITHFTHGCEWINPEGGYEGLRDWSTDLEDAWEIVEYLTQTEDVQIHYDCISKEWMVLFSINNLSDDVITVGATLPWTICRAAIKAVTRSTKEE